MVVDKAGNDRRALELDHPRARTGVFADFRVAADRRDALPFDRHRLADGEAIVHRHDLAADKYDVGSLRRLTGERNDEEKQDDQATTYRMHDFPRSPLRPLG